MTKDEALRMALEALEADELDMVDDGSGNMVFRKEQAITAIKEALAQPKKEPVAWMNDMGTHIDLNVSGRGTPLYTHPLQRKPLTKDEICAIGGIVAHGDVFFINIKQLNQLVGIKE